VSDRPPLLVEQLGGRGYRRGADPSGTGRTGYPGRVRLRILITVIASAGLVWVLMRRHNQRAQAEAELWAEATDPVD